MSHIGHITEGVRAANRNWPLVVVQLVLNVVAVFGFLLFVMLPTVMAVVFSGVNAEAFMKELERPENFDASMIPGSVVVVFLSALCLYLLIIMALWLFVYGGSAGALKRSFSEDGGKFSLDFFFSEGKRLFTPMLWLTSLVSLVLLGATLVFAVLMAPGALLGGTSTGTYLLKGLLLLLPVVVFFAGVFLTVALLLYGTAALMFDGDGAMKAFARSFNIVWQSWDAVCMVSVIMLGYLLAGIVFSAVLFVFHSTPLAGVLGLPLQLVFSAFQAYMNVVMLAAIFSYYKVTFGGSTPASGTSGESGPQSVPPRGDSALPG